MSRLLVVLALLFVAGCGGGDSAPTEDAPKKAKAARKANVKTEASGPTTETVSLTDPVDDAFTVDVPKGWDSVAYSSGEFDVHREVVSSVSPDGNTILFIGDPKIPNYWNPDTANPITVTMADASEFVELEHFRPAGEYFPQYADEKFGKLPGFEITDFGENPRTVKALEQQFAQAGLSATITAVDIFFDYEQDGARRNGLLVGVTIDGGDFWTADVVGLSTDGEISDYRPMLEAMAQSKKTNPEFTARMNAEHQRRMADIQAGTDAMTQQHEANMAAIQGSAQRHQERMDAIAASGAASTQAYEDRMSSMDTNQRQFLNYINDESTVVSPSGRQYQVDDGYQTYYVNPTDNSYVGGDINFNDSSLRRMGLNPDDYELVQAQP